MADVKKTDWQRKKSFKPKVKTGCITCRIRRVKCDESKPECDRCTSTGRKCDGYGPSQANSQAVVSKSPSRNPPRISMEPLFVSDMSTESQCLLFFQKYTAPEMAGHFDSKFWLRDVLQASHTHDAIRYAVIALGALHQKFISCALPVVPDDISDQNLRYGLKQCNRSIQEMVKQSRSSSLSRSDQITAMTACILFTCFASIQGHNSSTLQHLRGGLKLLRETDAENQTSPGRTSSHPVSIDSLRAMFISLDIHARGMINDDEISYWEPIPAADPQICPTKFDSLYEIHAYMEGTFNDFLTFLQSLDLDPPTTPEGADAVVGKYNYFMHKVKLGDLGLADYLNRRTTRFQPDEEQKLLSLQLHRNNVEVFSMLFRLMPTHGEMSWDQCEPQLKAIIHMSSQLLGADPESLDNSEINPSSEQYHDTSPPTDKVLCATGAGKPSHRPIFTLGFGVVISLWLVAFRSRHPILRRRAIALLLRYPRREAMWDSVLAGHIAWKSMMMEETAYLAHVGLPDADIRDVLTRAEDMPDELRTRNVAIVYTGLRQADVVFQSVRSWKNGEKGTTARLNW